MFTGSGEFSNIFSIGIAVDSIWSSAFFASIGSISSNSSHIANEFLGNSPLLHSNMCWAVSLHVCPCSFAASEHMPPWAQAEFGIEKANTRAKIRASNRFVFSLQFTPFFTCINITCLGLTSRSHKEPGQTGIPAVKWHRRASPAPQHNGFAPGASISRRPVSETM